MHYKTFHKRTILRWLCFVLDKPDQVNTSCRNYRVMFTKTLLLILYLWIYNENLDTRAWMFYIMNCARTNYLILKFTFIYGWLFSTDQSEVYILSLRKFYILNCYEIGKEEVKNLSVSWCFIQKFKISNYLGLFH